MTSSMSSQPSFSSSSSSSSSNHPLTYHVFLSFRGEDTRNNFTAHLYEALQRNGINTFIDDKLRCGEEISTTLLKTIEKSEISIIVFSKTYASSRWCLEELIKILDCRKTNKQHVLSLFYNVDPSDVRHQTNSIGEGLVELKTWYDDITVQKWRTALKEAANLSGMHLGSSGMKEPEFIGNIIKWVNSIIVKKTYIQVAQHPVVGIESPVQYLISLLNIEKKDSSYMVGIFGYSGIGKTTIAKTIYNSIASLFEGICFLEDIRETCEKDGTNGMIHLQNKLLSMILGDPSPQVDTVDQGITLIEERLCNLRVLLVLDDVDSSSQLVKLAGKCDWFGQGSRIIITTRNKHLLTVHGVQQAHQFQVKELDDKKALQLFSLIVFNTNEPCCDYREVTKDVVCYSEGLPLALTELALVLKGKDDIHFWKKKLDEYKKTPNNKIQKKLEVSYDGLCQNAKDIFRHIACFFKGEDVEYVKTILDICGFCSYTGFEDLKDNCLIYDQSSGSLMLHGLLQEMGREIVRKESLNEPGKRSRLWFHEDVCSVLEDETGTNSVEGIVIDLPDADLDNSPKAFAKMKRLKLFISRNALFSEQLHSLPNELRFLYWPKYTHKSLPSNFRGRKLVVLRMPYGRLEELKGIENFKSLTMMNLSNCKSLKEVPNVSSMLKLTTLILDDCVSLVKVHDSVGSLPHSFI